MSMSVTTPHRRDPGFHVGKATQPTEDISIGEHRICAKLRIIQRGWRDLHLPRYALVESGRIERACRKELLYKYRVDLKRCVRCKGR